MKRLIIPLLLIVSVVLSVSCHEKKKREKKKNCGPGGQDLSLKATWHGSSPVGPLGPACSDSLTGNSTDVLCPRVAKGLEWGRWFDFPPSYFSSGK